MQLFVYYRDTYSLASPSSAVDIVRMPKLQNTLWHDVMLSKFYHHSFPGLRKPGHSLYCILWKYSFATPSSAVGCQRTPKLRNTLRHGIIVLGKFGSRLLPCASEKPGQRLRPTSLYVLYRYVNSCIGYIRVLLCIHLYWRILHIVCL